MQLIHALDPLRSAVAGWREAGETIALVPTMGALHEGHLTLVRTARQYASRVAVSIFVNPLQFGVNEDLDAYPRQLERDCALLEGESTDLVWAPSVDVMYPAGFVTNVSVAGVSEGLCGGSRPGHFDGVATVVGKLFNQVLPDCALFGEKDWQQLAVIRRMARDLDLSRPLADSIIGVPTVREADGLAMSSRNAYLSPADRAAAASLPKAMRQAIAAITGGAEISTTLATLRLAVLAGGFASVDYAEVRDAENLDPVVTLGERAARLFVAARIGPARLIDNMPITA